MKFEAYWEDRFIPLEVTGSGARITLRAGNRTYEGEVVSIFPGQYSILFEGQVFDVHVEASHNGEFHVAFRGRRVALELVDPRKLKSLRYRHADSDGEVSISSPMPGKVIRLLVRSGQPVKTGQGLIVIEAMKMQNEIKSPRAGTVKSLDTHEGKTVNAGEELMVIA